MQLFTPLSVSFGYFRPSNETPFETLIETLMKRLPDNSTG
jgi:hypothetical protein